VDSQKTRRSKLLNPPTEKAAWSVSSLLFGSKRTAAGTTAAAAADPTSNGNSRKGDKALLGVWHPSWDPIKAAAEGSANNSAAILKSVAAAPPTGKDADAAADGKRDA
jgi:hypothetical protein